MSCIKIKIEITVIRSYWNPQAYLSQCTRSTLVSISSPVHSQCTITRTDIRVNVNAAQHRKCPHVWNNLFFTIKSIRLFTEVISNEPFNTQNFVLSSAFVFFTRRNLLRTLSYQYYLNLNELLHSHLMRSLSLTVLPHIN